MNDTTLLPSLSLPKKALVFDLDALYTCLQTIPDHRKKRGVRYPLASLLMIAVLAKLAGQDSSRGMAHWATLRTRELQRVFQLKHEHMPHYSTWSRVLGHAVEAEEVERVIGQFFARTSKTVVPQRGSIQLAIDGKTLRGTIPLGETEGAHLLAVYQPEEGVVLAQMNVKKKGREITFAPTLLRQIDLRGVVVSGDAMFDRRSLSRMIIQAGGDYLWTVKENEKELSADIALLFQPPRKLVGTSAPPMDFREATTIEKGHGRTDKRSILVSSLLAEYNRNWLNLAQVYKLERQSTNALGITKTQIRYGVTSLPEPITNPQRLLQLTRGHWGIENGLHYRRDVTFHEDRGQIRMGHAPEMFAVLNNIALGLFARQGETNMAHARREFAYALDASLTRLVA
jgi:predicted transposase YbfD/YdcC